MLREVTKKIVQALAVTVYSLFELLGIPRLDSERGKGKQQ